MAGRLILCATPIGNLGDAPPRLADALTEATVVYAEDTRRARTLLGHLGVKVELRSYFVGNEDRRSGELENRLGAGETIALITDAGTPGVADPGLTAVRAAVAAGAEVTAVPGPSAVTMALAVSGAPADRFVFEGFLPRSGSERATRIGAVAVEERTTVLFASPKRLGRDLTDLAEAAPDRPCVVCRELTKLHEEVWRGSLREAAEHWSGVTVRGEVTVVVFGASPAVPDFEGAVATASAAIEAGERPSQAVRRVASETGVSRSRLYEAVIGSD
jgi:16S rRNA (cytidine1402-2'-O)-methyltransferase